MSRVETITKKAFRDDKGGQFPAVTFKRYPDGRIEYTPGNQGLLKPMRVPGDWVARVEKAEKTKERLEKEILLNDNKINPAKPATPRYKGMLMHGVGGEKWELVATDGHRALMVPYSGAIKEHRQGNFTECDWGGYEWVNVADKEFHLAVKRALIMTGERQLIKLTFEGDQLTVQSSCSSSKRGEIDGDFEQTITLADAYQSERFEVGFNGNYLLDALGSWPIRLSWAVKNGDEKQVCFTPNDKSWKLAVMPMRI